MSKVLEDRYELLEEIGSGGRGIVYKGYHRLMERHIAVKMMHPKYADDIAFLKEFRQEARILAELKHPNIVEIYAISTTPDKAPYVVMEFLDGKTLSQLIEKDHPLPLSRCIELILQVTRGLQFAHDSGIIHRDLKPANIVVQKLPDGSELAKIVDFGLAREETVQSSTLTKVVGSPPYMSPEQCSGQRATPQSDLYSLGCTLYETVCGTQPFDGATSLELLRKHVEEPPLPPRQVRADIPVSLQNIILKLMSKAPNQRYASAAAAGADLSQVQQFLQGALNETDIVIDRIEHSGHSSAPTRYQNDVVESSSRQGKSKFFLVPTTLLLVLGIVAACAIALIGRALSEQNAPPTEAPPTEARQEAHEKIEQLSTEQEFKQLTATDDPEIAARNLGRWEKLVQRLDAEAGTGRVLDRAIAHRFASLANEYHRSPDDPSREDLLKAIAHRKKQAQLLAARHKETADMLYPKALLDGARLRFRLKLFAEAIEEDQKALTVLDGLLKKHELEEVPILVLKSAVLIDEIQCAWAINNHKVAIGESAKFYKLSEGTAHEFDAAAYYVRSLRNASKPKEAIELGEKALKQFPEIETENKFWVLSDVAQSYADLNDLQTGEKRFRHIIETAPTTAQSWVTVQNCRLQLAQVLHHQKRYKEEIQLLMQLADEQRKQRSGVWDAVINQLKVACEATGDMSPLGQYVEATSDSNAKPAVEAH